MAERIYKVTQKGASPRLVTATSRSAATNYVADDTITAELASQTELVRLVGEGIKVEAVKS